MNTFRSAALGGLRDAMRLRLALPLYLTGLIFGLIQTWPVIIGLASGRTNQLNLQQLLMDTDALTTLMFQSDIATATAFWLLLVPLLSFMYGLAYNLFSGGILSLWNGTRRFWPGSRHFFLAFTGLGLLLVGLAVVVMIAASVLAALNLPPNVTAIGAFVVLQVLNLVGEYARAIGVVSERRNPFALFGVAVSFCIRHPAALLFGLAGVLLHGALVAAYLGLDRVIGSSPLAIVLNQVLVFAWLVVKLLRLAWARHYVSLNTPPVQAATPMFTAPGDVALA